MKEQNNEHHHIGYVQHIQHNFNSAQRWESGESIRIISEINYYLMMISQRFANHVSTYTKLNNVQLYYNVIQSWSLAW